MAFLFQQPRPRNVAPYVPCVNLFTPEECGKIIALSETRQPRNATIGESVSGNIDRRFRSTTVYWVQTDPSVDWVTRRIADAVFAANQQHWRFHITGIVENLQLTHYSGTGNDHYSWHEDHSENGFQATRKLSCVVVLNDGYIGGDFELFHRGPLPECRPGSMIIFPSYKTHRVTPVTAGERWSLVSWVDGPPFA